MKTLLEYIEESLLIEAEDEKSEESKMVKIQRMTKVQKNAPILNSLFGKNQILKLIG